MTWYTWLLVGFTLGWIAHHELKLRPFARKVEQTARGIKDILDEGKK